MLSFPFLCKEQNPCIQVHFRKHCCHLFVYGSNFRLLLNYMKENTVGSLNYSHAFAKVSGAVLLTNMPALNLIHIKIALLSLGHCGNAKSIMAKYFQTTAM